MIKRIKWIGLVLGFLVWGGECFSQVAPGIEWQRCLGGSGNDSPGEIKQTIDGGYIVAGTSASSDGDVSNSTGSQDYWIVKLNSLGSIQWEKSYGGVLGDYAYSLDLTNDGGYIVSGTSSSNNGNVTGNHGQGDYWILKLDTSGNLQWQKCLGGTLTESAYSISQTSDNGFIVVGSTSSSNGDVTNNHGYKDYWIVKLDSNSNIQWQKNFGGSLFDEAYSVKQTSNGGYIVAGYIQSFDGDVTINNGYYDYWIVMLDTSGNLVWQKSYGGSGGDVAATINQTMDGGFIIDGYTGSNDSDVTYNHGYVDYWIVKIDSSGLLQWQKSFGGTSDERAGSFNSIKQTFDGGYIVIGNTISNNGDVIGNHLDSIGFPTYDYWVLKLDDSGNIKWQKCLGGTHDDYGTSIEQTSDHGYIISGVSHSNDGDVTGNHWCGSNPGDCTDFWIVKLAPDTITSIPTLQTSTFNLQLFPNPATSTIQLTFNTKHNGEVQCEIVNVMGERVFKKEFKQTDPDRHRDEVQLDVSSLAKGMYVVRVGDGISWENKKLVIE